MTTRVLYITWDGPHVSYLEGLFLPIFTRLKEHKIEITVLQFIWGEDEHLKRQEQVCKERGVNYQRVLVPRKAGAAATFLTAVANSRRVLKLARQYEIDLLMPRSFMPAISALHANAVRSMPFVYDADGLAIDEKADFAGMSRSGLTYRLLKRFEQSAITNAAVVIGRTPAACDIYRQYDKRPEAGKYIISVNGRDPEHFRISNYEARLAARRALKIGESTPLIIYSGSFGGKYCPPEMFRLFRAIKRLRPDAEFLVLTGSPNTAKAYISQFQIDLIPEVRIAKFTPEELPPYLSAGDIGLCFYQDTFSNLAFQATKLGEYLLCGLSVAGTGNALPFGLGDTAVCRTVGTMPDAELEQVAGWFVHSVLPQREAIRIEARRLGELLLSIDRTVASYATAIYRAIGRA
jgi:hypothetical protein